MQNRVVSHTLTKSMIVNTVHPLLFTAVSPHNCVGGSEMNCLPGISNNQNPREMFADPSKMQNMGGVPSPAHWYKSQAAFL